MSSFRGFGRGIIVKVQRGKVMCYGTEYEYGELPPNYPVPAIMVEIVTLHSKSGATYWPCIMVNDVKKGPGYWDLVNGPTDPMNI